MVRVTKRFKLIIFLHRLVRLSGLNTSLQTKESPIRFPVRAHAWVVGQVPRREHARGNYTLMFPSLSFSLPSPVQK